MLKNIEEKINFEFLIILFALGYSLIWLFTGFDLTDTGVTLLKQYTLLDKTRSGYEIIDLAWGSNFIGRFWNNILGQPSLIWSRLGYVLLFSSTILISYKGIRKVIKPSKLLLPFIITIILNPLNGVQLIHYYTLPTLFISITFLLYIKLLKEKSHNLYYSIGIGILIAFSSISNFSLILLIFLPIVIVIYAQFFNFNKGKFNYQHLIYVAIGFLTVTIVVSLVILMTDYMDTYYNALNEIFINGFLKSSEKFKGDNYTLSYQIINWLKAYLKIFIIVILFGGGIYAIQYIFNKLEYRKNIRILFYILAGGVTILIAIIKLGNNGIIDGDINFYRNTRLIYGHVIPGIIYFTFIILYIHNRINDRKNYDNYLFIYFLAIILMMIIPLGSDTFVAKFRYGYIFVLPITIATLDKLRKGVRQYSFNGFVRIFSNLTLVVFLTLGGVGIFYQFTGAFRDYPNRFRLTQNFGHESLNHIYSSRERVKTVDGVLEGVEKYSNRKDRILCVGKIPLIYYLTKRKPYIYVPWPTYLPQDQFSKLLKENRKKFNLPSLVVKTKYSVSNRKWPEEKTQYLSNLQHDDIIKKFIEENNYKDVYENEMFIIYKHIDSNDHSSN